MNRLHKKRLIIVSTVVVGVSLAIAIALFALRQNLNLFYTPSQVFSGKAPIKREFRVGGIVVPGSIIHSQQDASGSFILSDTAHTITVNFKGILPDLFAPGKGAVAEGHLTANGEFIADQVLAKHDKNYMPPEVADALKEAKQNS